MLGDTMRSSVTWAYESDQGVAGAKYTDGFLFLFLGIGRHIRRQVRRFDWQSSSCVEMGDGAMVRE